MGLAAINQISVIHEAINGCKDVLKACFENVNIALSILIHGVISLPEATSYGSYMSDDMYYIKFIELDGEKG